MRVQVEKFISKKDIKVSWGESHLYIPTPYELEDRLRVFVSIWDKNSIGRVGYVDLDKITFSVIGYSEQPSLNIGSPGQFDERGVTPMSLIYHKKVLFLFYTGWGNKPNYPYTLLTGLAYSVDHGKTFYRVDKNPILHPSNDMSIVKTAAFVKLIGNRLKMWYVGGENWTWVNGKHTPTYNLRTTESVCIYSWTGQTKEILKAAPDRQEFALGRPWVNTTDKGYELFISARTRNKGYMLTRAVSSDGNQWIRKDDSISVEETSLNNEMTCFSSFITLNNQEYLLYNGNQYGKDGFFISKCIR